MLAKYVLVKRYLSPEEYRVARRSIYARFFYSVIDGQLTYRHHKPPAIFLAQVILGFVCLRYVLGGGIERLAPVEIIMLFAVGAPAMITLGLYALYRAARDRRVNAEHRRALTQDLYMAAPDGDELALVFLYNDIGVGGWNPLVEIRKHFLVVFRRSQLPRSHPDYNVIQRYNTTTQNVDFRQYLSALAMLQKVVLQRAATGSVDGCEAYRMKIEPS